jgi:hypothetical protein
VNAGRPAARAGGPSPGMGIASTAVLSIAAVGSSKGALLLLPLLASAAAVGALRLQAAARRPPPIEGRFDVPPFPTEVARPFSFGLRALVADLAFLQAIQVFGGRKVSQTWKEGEAEDAITARLLNYSSELDSDFLGAYRFAGNALPRPTSDGKAGGVLAAEALVEKGTRNRPDDWRLWFMLGFLRSYYLARPLEAAHAMRQAAALPGAPAYLGLLATRLAADAGDLELAAQMAAAMAAEATEEASKAEWSQRLLQIDAERTLRRIDRAAAAFLARSGRPASGLPELHAAGDLPPLPAEPNGGRWLLGADGRGASTATPRLTFRDRRGSLAGLEVK